MRILGARVREYRKSRGLSQADLAKDICTQATISLIEKRNKIPSMQILLQLCTRLGVSIDDIIVENDYRSNKLFHEIAAAIRRGDFEIAETKLDTIKFSSLKEKDELKAYYYFRGEVQLANHKNADEAIFNFGMLLNQFSDRQQDMLNIAARLGLGLAYFERGAVDKAELLVNQAIKEQLLLATTGRESVQDQLRVLLRAAWFFRHQDHHRRALQLTDMAIKLSQDNDVLYLLEELYEIKALSHISLADLAGGQSNLYIAHALAVISHNEKIIDRVASDAVINKIPPLVLTKRPEELAE